MHTVNNGIMYGLPKLETVCVFLSNRWTDNMWSVRVTRPRVRDKKEDGDACYTMLTPENVLGGRGSPLRSISDSMPADPE